MGSSINSVDGQNGKVLVVDDNEDVRELLILQLRRLGYAVIAAGSAEAALRLVAEDPAVVLLLTDLNLPGGMNGCVLAERAQAINRKLAVLFTSGDIDFDALGLTSPPSSDRLLRKPFALQELAESVRVAIVDRSAARP
jgi:CheY-like chemotaxis protein